MTDEVPDKKISGDDMSPADRMAWLQERGVIVETSEDRKRAQISKIMSESDEVDGEDYEDLSFVHVPENESLPLKEITMKVSKKRNGGDVLMEYLKPFVSNHSNKVDIDLLKDTSMKQFGSGEGGVNVSEKSLKDVAKEGNVESFCLVQPVPSNKFVGINIYLDEVGLLKRLNLNKRAGEFALKAGFNPAPMFYGDVFIGRVTNKPVLKNINFKLGTDTSSNAKWLQTAVMGNLEHRTEMNNISGRPDQVQPSVDGEDGVAKTELGGLYEWTQTDDELEIVVPLGSTKDGEALTSKEVKIGGLKVKYLPRKLLVSFKGKELLSLDFYANIDPDGCMWTLDANGKGMSVVITCEKSDPISWPRIIK